MKIYFYQFKIIYFLNLLSSNFLTKILILSLLCWSDYSWIRNILHFKPLIYQRCGFFEEVIPTAKFNHTFSFSFTHTSPSLKSALPLTLTYHGIIFFKPKNPCYLKKFMETWLSSKLWYIRQIVAPQNV